MHWHQQKTDEAMQNLGSSTQGLSADEVRTRLLEHGSNELTESARKPVFMMFLDQFKDFMILVLIAAAVISGIIGEATDTIAIIVIVVLNAVIGFVQEFRAEKAMQQLMKMSAHSALVIRDGHPVTVPASQLVPGDVVILETGGIIPADMRLIEAARIKVEEATLTGESLPTEKHVEPLPDEHLPLGDRKNMAFKGTVVTYGRGATPSHLRRPGCRACRSRVEASQRGRRRVPLFGTHAGNDSIGVACGLEKRISLLGGQEWPDVCLPAA